MKIGIFGAGHIGGTLGKHWVDAGHQIVFGVRDPGALDSLLGEMGDRAAAGSPADAAAGQVLVFAGPFGAWPAFAGDNASALRGKLVIDASNPYPERDGEMARAALKSGTGSGRFVASLLPGSHVVKAFNTIYWVDLRDQAHRANPKLAMPIAGDDLDAVARTEQLAVDAGFDPIVVGGLAKASALDPGSPIYAKSFTAEQVRRALGLASSNSLGEAT